MRILISGASRGLGKALAETLAKAGHNLILIARSEPSLLSIKQNLEKTGAEVEIISTDLSKPQNAKEVFQQTKYAKTVDVIINNLGVYNEDKIETLELESLTNSFRSNLWSAIELTNSFIPSLKRRKRGIIININSVMGLNAGKHAASYSISKHALKAWSDALRDELKADGIKVTGIYPGAINTSSWDGSEANRSNMIQPDDIAILIEAMLRMRKSSLVEEIRISPRDFNF